MRKCGLDKVCYCGKGFYATPGALKKGHGIYCSTRCRQIKLWQDVSYKKHMSLAHKGIMPTNISYLIKRITSDKHKLDLITWLKKQTPEYRSKIHIGKHTGNKNSNWKGGITSKNKLERFRFRNTIWKLVLERDGYTCQMCGIKGKDMTVDHIQSWAEYVELRFCIDNCRTLCAKCHYKITFGKPMPPTVRSWGHKLKEGMSNFQ